MTTQNPAFIRFHALFAILAAAGFTGHLVANLFVDQLYWLPEYIWGASVMISVLTIYAGCSALFRAEPQCRGTALASTIVGAITLIGLMYSGITWLFVAADMSGVAM